MSSGHAPCRVPGDCQNFDGVDVDSTARVAVIIPALNEEGSIYDVVRGFREVSGPQVSSNGFEPLVSDVVVADNGSSDHTAERARSAGAQVVQEPARGYGRACLAAMAYLASHGAPDVVVFADGDGSQRAEDIRKILAPIYRDHAKFVVGSRMRGSKSSMTVPQRYGNHLAGFFLSRLYGVETTDLGPFRAITWGALQRLEMSDPSYGWTVEMQIKAARLGVPTVEVFVDGLPRMAGQSKVSGTVRGVVGASTTILYHLLKGTVA